MRANQVHRYTPISTYYLQHLDSANTLAGLIHTLHRWRDFASDAEAVVRSWDREDFALWRTMLEHERLRERGGPDALDAKVVTESFYKMAAFVMLPNILAALRSEGMQTKTPEGDILAKWLESGRAVMVGNRIMLAEDLVQHTEDPREPA